MVKHKPGLAHGELFKNMPHVSQCSVVTLLWCGGIFSDELTVSQHLGVMARSVVAFVLTYSRQLLSFYAPLCNVLECIYK